MKYLSLLLFFAVVVGCGASQKVGVRSTFKNRTVDRLAIVTVYSTGSFSQEDAAFESIHQMYVEATEQMVKELGFQSITIKQFDASFKDDASRNAFWDGIPIHRSLDELFEPAREEPGPEVTTVKTFSPSLPAKTLLIAEVVYYAEATCETEPRDHSPYAIVEPPNASLPSACIISHFQAKLIDAETGGTMWHNRVLLERRDVVANPDAIRDVIFKSVQRVLGAENGIASFRGMSKS